MPFQGGSGLPEPGSRAMEALSKKRILFEHMSVGYDIMAGVEELKAENNGLAGIRIMRIESPDEITGPGIHHASIGFNGEPKKKIDAFRDRLLDGDLGGRLDIAILKLCYVDITRQTDAQDVLKHYGETLEALKARFPGLKFVHVTVPLFAHSRGLRSFARNIIKGDPDNVRRDEYNRLLLEAFGGTDPVYDLARLESTTPRDKRVGFRQQGRFYPALYKGYTTDGGHLNSLGRRKAAKGLLALLAGL